MLESDKVRSYITLENYNLTIVIPTYNVENYIEENLNSLVEQKTNYIFEVVIVDDGSKDKTVDIVKRYCEKFKNFKLYLQKNNGAGSARNTGIKKATGEYIHFLDSDDYVSTSFVEDVLATAYKNYADIVLFSGKSFSEEREDTQKIALPNYLRNNFVTDTSSETIRLLVDQGNYLVSPCLYITKLDKLKLERINFPEGIILEDNYFTLYNIFTSKKAVSLKNVYYYRRVRASSVMNATKKEFGFYSASVVLEKSLDIAPKFSYIDKKYIRKVYKIIYTQTIFRYFSLEKSVRKRNKEILNKSNQAFSAQFGKIITKVYFFRALLSRIKFLIIN